MLYLSVISYPTVYLGDWLRYYLQLNLSVNSEENIFNNFSVNENQCSWLPIRDMILKISEKKEE